MRLTKATYCQLEILIFVHEHAPETLSVSSISDALQLSSSIGLKLVNRLVKAGLLLGKRGPGGGVMLAKPSSQISLGATIRQLEAMNRVDVSEDLGTERASKFVSGALDCFLEVLDGFTLQDLGGGRPQLKLVDRKALKAKDARRTLLVALERAGS
jgi:Rrf2 family transcriptional regulator, nitric oxide-sensitive transcriptional repressor